MVIGEELLAKEAALLSNNFGRILSNNYALPLLKSQKADWKSKQEHDSKKRKLFAGIVEPLGKNHFITCFWLFGRGWRHVYVVFNIAWTRNSLFHYFKNEFEW